MMGPTCGEERKKTQGGADNFNLLYAFVAKAKLLFARVDTLNLIT